MKGNSFNFFTEIDKLLALLKIEIESKRIKKPINSQDDRKKLAQQFTKQRTLKTFNELKCLPDQGSFYLELSKNDKKSVQLLNYMEYHLD